MVRYTVHFSGRVQGVGFRYSAASIASRHPVAGYVRNLDDGRVLLAAEGALKEIDEFVNEVRRRMDGYIRDCEIVKGEATGEFGGAGSFEVRS